MSRLENIWEIDIYFVRLNGRLVQCIFILLLVNRREELYVRERIVLKKSCQWRGTFIVSLLWNRMSSDDHHSFLSWYTCVIFHHLFFLTFALFYYFPFNIASLSSYPFLYICFFMDVRSSIWLLDSSRQSDLNAKPLNLIERHNGILNVIVSIFNWTY